MLRYMGGGILIGVPARDMNEKEAEQYGGAEALVATGLWALDLNPAEPILPIEQAVVQQVVEVTTDSQLEGRARRQKRIP